MNKFITKLAKLFLGISMAAGVGVALEVDKINSFFVTNAAEDVVKSVTISEYASSHSWGSSSSAGQKSIDLDSYVNATCNSGTNSGKYYNDGWRIYQTETGKITISTTNGNLKSATFTFTVSNTGKLSYGGSALVSGTAVAISGTSAEFVVGNTGSATNGQVRITVISVTYTLSGGGDVPVDPEAESSTITFGTNAQTINDSNLTFDDSLRNTWTVTPVWAEGQTKSYTNQTGYVQIGASAANKKITSISLSMSLSDDFIISAFTVKVGGYAETNGTATLKVNNKSVGSGSISSSDNTIEADDTDDVGDTLTVDCVANGTMRFKLFYISYEITPISDSSTAASIDGATSVSSGVQWTTGGITEDESGNPVLGATYAFASSQGVTITASSTSNGTFTATTATSGTVTVSATLEGYNIQSLVVTVENTDPFINLTLTSGNTGYTGQTVTISATSGHLTENITWTVTVGSVSNPSSSNSGYSGKLASSGTVTIQASANGVTQSVSVTVTKTAFTTSPSDASVNEGSDVQLSAVLNSDGSITWESDDDSIATVNSSGLVTGVSAGTTTIFAKSTDDTTVQATCEITVNEVLIATHTYGSSDSFMVNIQKNSTTVATATMAQNGTRTNPTWNGTNSEFRLYGTSSLTIVPAVNYEIVSFTCVFTTNKSSGNIPTLTYSADGSAAADVTTGTKYTVDNPDEIVISTSDKAGNYGFKSISVEYAEAETVVTLESISYSGTLLKPTQYVGQDFDSVGLSFTAHYDNEQTAPLLTSDIEWDDLALGSSVTGSYQDVDVTVTGLTIINTSDVNEIIFFNNLSNDSTSAYSDLETHSKIGSFTEAESGKVYNGKDSSLKFGSADEGGSYTLTNTKSGYYISEVIVIAKTFVSSGASPTPDETTLNVSGTSTSDAFSLTSEWAVYSLDVSDDEGNSVVLSTTGKNNRCYIHSVTLILAAEDKTAVTFAHKILDELTCTASGNSAPSTTQWGNLRTYYITGTNVSVDGKELLETTLAPYETWKDYEVTQYSTESEIICAALAKYDYVIRKYKTTNYEDFIGRFGEGKVNGQLSPSISPLVNIIGENTNTIAIIVIISMVSVTAIGGYFFLRKRKEQ